jgi:hypothetical protein
MAECVSHWALFGLIVLPYVTHNMGGWERKETLKAFVAPPTIEIHSMENFKWADGLDFCQFLEVSLLPQSAPLIMSLNMPTVARGLPHPLGVSSFTPRLIYTRGRNPVRLFGEADKLLPPCRNERLRPSRLPLV